MENPENGTIQDVREEQESVEGEKEVYTKKDFEDLKAEFASQLEMRLSKHAEALNKRVKEQRGSQAEAQKAPFNEGLLFTKAVEYVSLVSSLPESVKEEIQNFEGDKLAFARSLKKALGKTEPQASRANEEKVEKRVFDKPQVPATGNGGIVIRSQKHYAELSRNPDPKVKEQLKEWRRLGNNILDLPRQ